MRTRSFTWMSRHPWLVGTAAVVLTALLALPFLTMAPDGTASQEPDGEIFDARDLVAERLAPASFQAVYIVEARDGDVLAPTALRQLRARADAVRSDDDIAPRLVTFFDPSVRREVTGLWTIADRVDAALRERTGQGIDTATDAEVRTVTDALVDEVGPGALQLSTAARRDAGSGHWTAPAATVALVADNAALGGGSDGVTLGSDDTTKEEFARDVQHVLRDGRTGLAVWGVAIDVNLTSAEQGQAAGPFIGLTIFAVLVLVGLTFRSYWAVAVSGAAIVSLIVWLFGLSNLVGFQQDQILSTIVPIALVSFGVDFAFHALGRYREERATGLAPRAAVTTGLAAVIGALGLALASDAAAFLANVAGGIESIVQFGFAAAFGLAAAFVLLGVVTPVVVGALESRTGRRASGRRGRSVLAVVGAAAAAATAMGAVLLAVFVAPPAGLALLAGYVLLFVVTPGALAGRRSDVDVESAGVGSAIVAERRAPLSRSRAALGGMVVAVARRAVIVLPLAAVVTAVAAVAALRVPTEFDVRDFFAADTDFVVGLDKLDEHVGEQGGEPAVVSVEADLRDPAAVAALDRFAADVRQLDSDRFARDDAGVVELDTGVLALLDDVQRLPEPVATAAGLPAIDARPEAARTLAQIYDVALADGVPFDAERLAWTADRAGEVLWTAGDAAHTRMVVGLPGSRAVENVNTAADELAPLVDRLEDDLQEGDADARVVVTGGPLVRAASLDAITASLQRSLPLAVALCLLIAGIFMRSLRSALISVVPILLVVTWLYALMYVWGYSLNLVTATIGAISIGIGIDFAIHLVMRYREELGQRGEREPALRAAGEGTGTALVASAASSIVGFAILAFAPMPLFASYGLLTAVMIALALVATLLVIPPLLWVTTARPGRVRAEADDARVPVTAS
jgi:predicted RND superfamily exporter protein